jgi:hypothetical protein
LATTADPQATRFRIQTERFRFKVMCSFHHAQDDKGIISGVVDHHHSFSNTWNPWLECGTP